MCIYEFLVLCSLLNCLRVFVSYLLVVRVRDLLYCFGTCWFGSCVRFVFGVVFAGFVNACFGLLVVCVCSCVVWVRCVLWLCVC